MKRPRTTEAELHRSVAQLFDRVLPAHVFATTFPAGGGGEIRGAMLKAAGLAAGVPDWLVVHGGDVVWIELKNAAGRLSPAQLATHARLRAAGCPVYVCRSLDDVIAALHEAGVPTKARAAA